MCEAFVRYSLVAILLAALVPGFAQSSDTPAQRRIAAARQAIAANPDRYEPYNDLALGLTRRARETADPTLYAQAEEALQDSFRLSPGNLEGERVRIWALLGRHEFAKALELAAALNRKIPDDLLVYGFLTDANAELGNYEEAEKACQWMLDLRQGNVAGLTRAAYLREIFGDVEGAIQLMELAYQRTPPDEVEDRAWALAHVAHLELMRGRMDPAEKLLEEALGLFPGYHYALAGMAKLRTNQKRANDAVDLLRRRYQAAPHPENLYALAEALGRAGRRDESAGAFLEFERKARAEMNSGDNSNRELIFYYTDHAAEPREALRIAEAEIARRRDVFTRDAYAWALHSNGRDEEARRQIEQALAVGILEARMLYRAGKIALAQKDKPAAARYLQRSLELEPSFEYSEAARLALDEIQAVAETPAASAANN
jgi:tetratricopeptide (TPR) repeat protein